MKRTIILASGSPRRIELLRNSGFDPIVIPANIEETIDESLSPDELVQSLAFQKADSVRSIISDMIGLPSSGEPNIIGDELQLFNSTELLSGNPLIIGADTIVYLNGKIIGKPINKDDAISILMDLMGKEHQVYTGVAMLPLRGENMIFSERTSVFFKEYTVEDLEEYLNTDEPYDKAGAYAIQGYFARFIDHIEGDYENVIGLPSKAKELLNS